ncbi:MAG: hypothetical protein HFJ85_05105 [Oscillospiraceae bacterium]|nr:hypothetical protein [Oscillospiraceae bacterium]
MNDKKSPQLTKLPAAASFSQGHAAGRENKKLKIRIPQRYDHKNGAFHNTKNKVENALPYHSCSAGIFYTTGYQNY